MRQELIWLRLRFRLNPQVPGESQHYLAQLSTESLFKNTLYTVHQKSCAHTNCVFSLATCGAKKKNTKASCWYHTKSRFKRCKVKAALLFDSQTEQC